MGSRLLQDWDGEGLKRGAKVFSEEESVYDSDKEERMWQEPSKNRTEKRPRKSQVGGEHQQLLAIARGLQRRNTLRRQPSFSLGGKGSKLSIFLIINSYSSKFIDYFPISQRGDYVPM